ncbi:MAG: hypothetical protein JWP89_5737 [Schlesneria sp.]|nr:hypothetical protein [Schlesneria sp.]
MKTTRLFKATLFAGVAALAGLFSTASFSQDKEKPTSTPTEAKMEAALSKLPKADRTLADAQRYCPIMNSTRMGAMGTPVKIVIDGKPVFLCCAGCKESALADGKETLAAVEKLKKATAALAKLPAADLPLAEAQLLCPIQEGSRLGSMGTPVKLTLDGKPVFLCCKGCEDAARENPKATLAKVEEIKKESAKGGPVGR